MEDLVKYDTLRKEERERLHSESKTHQEDGSLIPGGEVVMELEMGIVAAASASPCSSIGEGGGAKGDKNEKKQGMNYSTELRGREYSGI